MPRKPPGLSAPHPLRRASDFTTPPKSPSPAAHGAKVVVITDLVAARVRRPRYFLDVTKDRILRDWLRGVNERALRVVYECRREEIEDAIYDRVCVRLGVPNRRAA